MAIAQLGSRLFIAPSNDFLRVIMDSVWDNSINFAEY